MKKFYTSKKFYLRTFITLIISLFIIIIISNKIVTSTTKNQIYNSAQSIPFNKVGLVLGTSKYMISGNYNAYYTYRINATYKLFKAGKIKYIIVSGDNGTKYYNEPKQMKKDLIAKGIPANKIFEDYAGFRTLDSVIRSKKVFGQKSITIISQKFHIERALFIANHNNINAVGYIASKVSNKYGFKTKIREKLARVKVMIDLLFNKQPKFLGDPIIIK